MKATILAENAQPGDVVEIGWTNWVDGIRQRAVIVALGGCFFFVSGRGVFPVNQGRRRGLLWRSESNERHDQR